MTSLWKHQSDAVDEAVKHMPGGFGFFMEMGTGKTLAAIETLRRLKALRILVLCPKSVGSVWCWELQKHWPDGPPAVSLIGSAASRALTLQRNATRRLVAICNYEAAWREPLAKALVEGDWDALVLDESHRIKAARGKASTFVGLLAQRVPVRLALTGTPVPHSVLDVWGQYRALDPTVFPSTFTAFRYRYSRLATKQESRDTDTYLQPGKGGVLQRWKFQNLDDLQERMYRIAFRVRADDVLDLPETLDVERTCELEPGARRVYQDLERHFVSELASGVVTAANAAVKVMRLAQVTGGTVITHNIETGEETREHVSGAKADVLRDIIEDAGTEPIVVFCRFHSDLDAVHAVCATLLVAAAELSGRRNELHAWQDGGARVLVVQVQAGGLGIDLTRARIAVYYSLGYSLAEYEQSRARLHRPGQTRPVEYLHLVASGTVDGLIYEALRARADVVASVVERLGK